MKKLDRNNYSINTSIVELTFKYKASSSVMPVLRTSQDAYEILRNIWNAKDNIDHIESAQILLLNRANKIHGTYELSVGGITGTVMDINIIAQAAILSNSKSIILCHNHPSSNCKPSDSDRSITKKIKEALNFLDIAVLDHIILTENSYYSFADEGIL